MGKKTTTYRSKIPPPSWDQVAWLSIGGVVWLLITYLMSFYHHSIQARESVETFDRYFEGFYGFSVFLCLVAVSAIVLAMIKAFNIWRIANRNKSPRSSKKKK